MAIKAFMSDRERLIDEAGDLACFYDGDTHKATVHLAGLAHLEARAILEETEPNHGPDRELVALPYLCAIDSRRSIRRALADALRVFVEE